MYPNQKTLAQEVKQEVIADLQRGNFTGIPQPGRLQYPNFEAQGQWEDISLGNPDQTYQTVKESVKNEILADMQMQQLDRMAQVYGLDRSLSDRKIQQMIDARYQAIDNLKADIKKELLALQETETQRARDPYIRQTANLLAEEARRQGIPQEQLVRSLDQKTSTGTGLMGRLSEELNRGQRRGFLYGVGMGILCHLLLPSSRKTMRSIAVHSMEEGIAMVDRAKSFVSGRPQQGPPPNSAAPVQQPPPQQPPPEGDQPPTDG
ncbi:MAG: hypothetical protein GX996_01980 [Firmicutes bacterium]|nr:hypothetical protein [Bacillota bacterium]